MASLAEIEEEYLGIAGEAGDSVGAVALKPKIPLCLFVQVIESEPKQ